MQPQEKSVVEKPKDNEEMVEEPKDDEVVEKPKEKGKSNIKNTNLTDPRKLSDILMAVLGTEQRYMTPNGLRSVFAAYLKRNQNIKVDTCDFDSG